MDRLWDVLGDVAQLIMGPVVAWTVWGWLSHPERAPAWAARGPLWAVRCWVAGFVLLGIGMGSSGVYGLTGLTEPWVVGFCRAAGPMLYLLVVWLPFVHGAMRRGDGRSPVSGAAEGALEGGRDDDGSPRGHVA
ncbi:hypothetical protein [Streptomyces sp. bgisy060]|uniref:hypothetical protein n=1 Tax=Streptomyces sp. bgisy060 TaxID=3413775 RepID=UPI003EB6F54F